MTLGGSHIDKFTAYYNGSGYKVEAKVGQQGIVGHGGDYAGARHSSESQGPGLPGTEDFGHSQRELSAVGGGKEPVQERRHDAVPHEMMPGSQTLSLEPCNTGPCEGPDCGGGVGCHGYGMGDD